jgi:hypothetical protein
MYKNEETKMKQDDAERKEGQTELEKIEAMWEKGRQLQARKQYWYELQFQGWIKARSRREAKQKLEEYFSATLGIKVLYSTGADTPPKVVMQGIEVPFDPGLYGPAISLDIDDALAEITHMQVRILWFKP